MTLSESTSQEPDQPALFEQKRFLMPSGFGSDCWLCVVLEKHRKSQPSEHKYHLLTKEKL